MFAHTSSAVTPTQASVTLDNLITTPASATLFYRPTPPVTSSTVQIPFSTSTQPAIAPPPIQTYTTFDSLFPLNQYPSLPSMPTSLLIHTLVRTLWWTTTMLRGFMNHHAIPTALDPIDELGRMILRNTPMWPGDEHTMTSSLDELLVAMMPRYIELLYRGSYNY